MTQLPNNVVETSMLHNRNRVFADRQDAGRQLAALLKAHGVGSDAVVLAIPAGGVPVAAVVAEELGCPLDVLVVSKITLPWNTESGYGAVAADGSVALNEALVQRAQLDAATVQAGTEQTRQKVARREQRFREALPQPTLTGHGAILVDDGLASGITMQVAIESARKLADPVIVAVPTGHGSSVRELAASCDRLYCANIREGFAYAVADAYEQWSDVTEDEALSVLADYTSQHPVAG